MIEAMKAIMPSQSGLTDPLEASLVQNAKEELSGGRRVCEVDGLLPTEQKKVL